MKHLKLLLGFIVIFAALQISSCGKGFGSPVDQIVEMLDEAADKTDKITSEASLLNVQNLISPDEIYKIINDNSDYELTKGDKEKLKKSYNHLVKSVYEKTSEFVPSEEMKKVVKNQLDLMMEGINRSIDNATTLGSIKGWN